MRSLVIVLGVVIIGLVTLTFKVRKDLNEQIRQLREENAVLIKKQSVPIPFKDDKKLLEAYQKCFIKLLKESPECAKKFSKLMQDYE